MFCFFFRRLQKTILSFLVTLILSSANSVSSYQYKILSFGKERVKAFCGIYRRQCYYDFNTVSVAFYLRNDIHNFCHFTVLIPKSVRPLACSFFCMFVRAWSSYIFFFFFSNYQFPTLALLTTATSALSTL